MNFWFLTEILLIILVATFLLSQMVIPAIFGKPLFWLFRSTGREFKQVTDDIQETELALDVERMRAQLLRLEKELKEYRKKKGAKK